jgi:glycyl-tRNA synthetase
MNNKSAVTLEDIVSLCKRRGFIFQGSEIYGGLAGTWDYGPLGVQLKKNLMDLWWKTFVEDRDYMVGLDAAILMNPRTWQASGHVDTFVDPLCEDIETKRRFRTDHILKDNGFNPEGLTMEQMDVLIAEKSIKSPDGNDLSNSRTFNMMFKTTVGPIDSDDSVAYLRPETAQGIFTNFKNVVDTLYPDVPFGIAQIGKAFRNEISPRDFVFRSREFNQMEIEYFIHESQWEEEFEKWRSDIQSFLEQAGVDTSRLHELEVPDNDLAHYSKRTIDYEFEYPHGKDELLGLAYRTDFDLQNVQRESGKKTDYRPKEGGEAYVPHVIEPSFGVERLFMAVMVSAFKKDIQNGEERVYLQLPKNIAPIKYCVSPLLKNKPELVTEARKIYNELRQKYSVMWDDNGNIGKRYRRQDEIGTPYCIVIDFDTLEDGTVTVRDRDTTQQKRVTVEELV